MTSSRKKGSHWPISTLSSLSALINMALPLFLVRWLPQEEVGQFKIFFLYLMMIPSLSLAIGIFNGLAYWAGKGEKGIRAIRQSSILILGVGLVASILAFLFRDPLASHFGWTPTLTILFSLGVFGSIVSMFFEEAAITTGRIWTGAIFHSGFEILRTLAIIFAAFTTRSLEMIALAHTAMVGIKVLAGYGYGMKLGLIGWTSDKKVFREVLTYAWPVSTALLFGVFSGQADKIILSNTIVPAEFAIYALGCLMIPPLFILEQSVTRVLIPRLSEAFEAKKINQARELYRQAVDQIALLTIPAVVGLVIFAEPIIHLLFTEAYSDSIRFLKWYAIGYLFLMIPFDSTARAQGKSKWIMTSFMVFSVFSLLLCGALAIPFGAMGALSGVLISKGLKKLYGIYYIHQDTGWEVRKFLPLTELALTTALSLVLGLTSYATRTWFDSSLLWFAVTGTLFFITYILAILPLRNLLLKANTLEANPQQKGKVLMLTQYLGIGGLEKMIFNLSLGLQDQDRWDLHVFAYDQDSNSEYKNLIEDFREKEIPVETFKKKNGFSFKALWLILKYLFRNQIDVLHSHDLGSLIYAVLAKTFSVRPVRLIHTQHSFVHMSRAARYQIYEKFFTFFVDELTVVSPDNRKKYLQLGIPEKKVHVIQNGVTFPPRPSLDRGEKLSLRKSLVSQEDLLESPTPCLEQTWILYLARIHPVKGHFHAVDLWGAMDPKFRSQSALLMVGPSTDDETLSRLQEKIKNTQGGDRIFLTGGTHHPEKWIQASDVFLSCSEFEGMPLVPTEAIGGGLPAVLSSIPGHETFSNHSRQFPLEDVSRGAKEVEALLLQVQEQSPEKKLKLWEQVSEIRKEFSVGAMAENYALLYSRGYRGAS